MTPPRNLLSSLRSARKERRSRKQTTDSSTTTEDFLPTSPRSCASAFYSHPPTTISLDQLKHGQRATKTVAVELCHEKMLGSSSESTRPMSLFSMPAIREEDVERRAGCCSCAGKPRWSRRQVAAFKVLLGVFVLGIAVMLGVVISITVGNGHIQSVFSRGAHE